MGSPPPIGQQSGTLGHMHVPRLVEARGEGAERATNLESSRPDSRHIQKCAGLELHGPAQELQIPR